MEASTSTSGRGYASGAADDTSSAQVKRPAPADPEGPPAKRMPVVPEPVKKAAPVLIPPPKEAARVKADNWWVKPMPPPPKAPKSGEVGRLPDARPGLQRDVPAPGAPDGAISMVDDRDRRGRVGRTAFEKHRRRHKHHRKYKRGYGRGRHDRNKRKDPRRSSPSMYMKTELRWTPSRI